MKRLLIGITLLLATLSVHAQVDQKWDERLAVTVIDSFINQKKETNPKKAAILSAVFPGAGQFYNGQYYKIAIVYGGIGALIYTIDFNKRQFDIYDEAYRLKLKGLPNQFPETVPIGRLENRREEARKNKELAYFGLGFVYLLNIADAFVSSHLTTFNIDDDLITGRIKLFDSELISGSPYPAVGVSITF